MMTQEATYYFHNSHLNTPMSLTDSQQQVVWQAKYDAFGKASIVSQGIENNLRFPGQYYDQESGLHYNYFRDYDPELGRYIQSDPIGLAGGINTYGYVKGNPINATDPYGLDTWGFSVGFGYTTNSGVSYGGSATFALDSNGDFAVLANGEGGVGGFGKGLSLFGRDMFGFGDNTIDTLRGLGGSFSFNKGAYSGSVTFPHKANQCNPWDENGGPQSYPPVVEFGWGRGQGASMTGAYGDTAGYGDIQFRWSGLGDLGRWIGGGIYDLTH
ncbi:RHS repeat-associated core domain-containing protein [Shewanella halifaxensis]|uniref:RHS repeat-associated core domain-containing protein n=1 Tax=Shewanella halifaxensis TaxID=271098 RepID=UPI000D59C4B6|nr:RHS repeat-associated core domain-containing protein [Shewanella halifaxensis]